jgi:hypothetical protein
MLLIPHTEDKVFVLISPPTGWPSCTSRHRVPILSSSTTCRAMVELLQAPPDEVKLLLLFFFFPEYGWSSKRRVRHIFLFLAVQSIGHSPLSGLYGPRSR